MPAQRDSNLLLRNAMLVLLLLAPVAVSAASCSWSVDAPAAVVGAGKWTSIAWNVKIGSGDLTKPCPETMTIRLMDATKSIIVPVLVTELATVDLHYPGSSVSVWIPDGIASSHMYIIQMGDDVSRTFRYSSPFAIVAPTKTTSSETQDASFISTTSSAIVQRVSTPAISGTLAMAPAMSSTPGADARLAASASEAGKSAWTKQVAMLLAAAILAAVF
ncbi:hypothetical protein DFJ74DRAFT_690703 [Hyaloraphidium curvatum]|nr:hypothetical protein DFJ74DRAFT_690703 [Hyaloraphidium curvatum]